MARNRNLKQIRGYLQTRKERINALKEVPCLDCGNSYPHYVMDFDHRPGEVKLFNIGTGYWRKWEAVLAEIAKCDVVCSNCHRERTHVRLNTLEQTYSTHKHGEQHPEAKLTDADALAIFQSKDTHRDLAKRYGVSKACIWQIRTKKTWNHIHK